MEASVGCYSRNCVAVSHGLQIGATFSKRRVRLFKIPQIASRVRRSTYEQSPRVRNLIYVFRIEVQIFVQLRATLQLMPTHRDPHDSTENYVSQVDMDLLGP